MEHREKEKLDYEEIDTMPKEEQPEETEKASEAASSLFDWVSAAVTAVLAVVLVFTFFVQMISVEGPSMQPTLYEGDRLIVLNNTFCNLKAGDVVIAEHYNAQLSDRIVKRIIATGGQTVDIDFVNGIVYVDGIALEEDYIKDRTYMEEGLQFPLTLAENEVFLMGDNRNHSTDSRSITLGPVDEQYIVGKAVFLLVPGTTVDIDEVEWDRIGVIK